MPLTLPGLPSKLQAFAAKMQLSRFGKLRAPQLDPNNHQGQQLTLGGCKAPSREEGWARTGRTARSNEKEPNLKEETGLNIATALA